MGLEALNTAGKEEGGPGKPGFPLSHGVSIINSSYAKFFIFLRTIIEIFGNFYLGKYMKYYATLLIRGRKKKIDVSNVFIFLTSY